MWVFENKTGKRTDATIENATEMVKKDGGFSCLWPRGTEKEEETEFKRLVALDESLIPTPPKPPADSQEVHVMRSRNKRDPE